MRLTRTVFIPWIVITVNNTAASSCGSHLKPPLLTLGVSSNSDEGSLRLVGGASAPPAAGRLEIFLEGEWGSVCGAEFDHLAAHVACQQLDYGTAVSVAPGR